MQNLLELFDGVPLLREVTTSQLHSTRVEVENI